MLTNLPEAKEFHVEVASYVHESSPRKSRYEKQRIGALHPPQLEKSKAWP